MAGSGDELAARAADRNLLRASDADREQVIAVLKSAFIQGRLTKDEFDLRVGRVFVSRTHTDLDVLTADIPAGLTKAQQSEPGRQPNSKKLIRRRTAAGIGATVVISTIMVAMSPHPATDFIIVPVLSSIITVLIAEFSTIFSWILDKNSAGKPSQGHHLAHAGPHTGSPSSSARTRPATPYAG